MAAPIKTTETAACASYWFCGRRSEPGAPQMKMQKRFLSFFQKALILCFSCQSFAYDRFFEPDYPFQPFVREIPASVLKQIQDNDILFVGESHVPSAYLIERRKNSKLANSAGRRKSLNQESLFFNLAAKFSETHAASKKCLWLEYRVDNSDLEKKLSGFHTSRSHYWLIRTAKAEGWSVFAVDENGRRDFLMAENIANTIQDGQCEKGIAVNGHSHLSCEKEPATHCRDSSSPSSFPSVDKWLERHLKNIGLVKSIGILRIVTYNCIARPECLS